MARFERYNVVRCIKPAAPMQAGLHVVVSVGAVGLVLKDRYGYEFWVPFASVELVDLWPGEDPGIDDIKAGMVESYWVPTPQPVEASDAELAEELGLLKPLLK